MGSGAGLDGPGFSRTGEVSVAEETPDQACDWSFHVTALPAQGGMACHFAIGAVIDGVPTTTHTPLSGQVEPVLAVVPSGAAMLLHLVFRVRGRALPGARGYRTSTLPLNFLCMKRSRYNQLPDVWILSIWL